MDTATITELWSFSERCPSADTAWLSRTSTLSTLAVGMWVIPDKHTCQLLSTQEDLDKTHRIAKALRTKTKTRSVLQDKERI